MSDLHTRDLLEISTYSDVEDVSPDCQREECGAELSELPMPDVEPGQFPTLMPVGKPLFNWLNDVVLRVRMPDAAAEILGMPQGECNLMIYTHGLAFIRGINNYRISFDQVLSVYPLTHESLEKRKGSGGILNAAESGHARRLVLEYLDVAICRPRVLILHTRQSPRAFLTKLQSMFNRRYEVENHCKYVYNVLNDDKTLDATRLAEASRSVPTFEICKFVGEATGRERESVLKEARNILAPLGLKVEPPVASRYMNIAILATLALAAIGLMTIF